MHKSEEKNLRVGIQPWVSTDAVSYTTAGKHSQLYAVHCYTALTPQDRDSTGDRMMSLSPHIHTARLHNFGHTTSENSMKGIAFTRLLSPAGRHARLIDVTEELIGGGVM